MLNKLFYRLKAFLNFIFPENSNYNENWIYDGDFKCNNYIPKKIWLYWDSDEKNDLIDFCFKSVKLNCPEYKIEMLNSKNISNFIDISILNNKNLQKAVEADYIRLSLLKKYGGIWIDASIILLDNLDWILNKINGRANFLFYTDTCTIDINNPVVENWFIISSENNEFINDWFDEFSKCISSENPTTYYESYKNKKEIIQNIPNTDYLMCYISASIIRARRKYDIAMLNSGSQGHYYNYRFFSNSLYIALVLFIFNKDKVYCPKIIKLTKDTRKYPSIFLENNWYSSRSMLINIFKNKIK